jgi:hypothetical protein
MHFTTTFGNEFIVEPKPCTAKHERALRKKKGWDDEDLDDMRYCQPIVVDFDVDGRYLMGFIGSSKANNVIALGPVVSRKIV